MEYRIDGVVTPPGIISRARTYSLILKDEGLYVIHTGPANGRSPNSTLRVNGVLTGAAANVTAQLVDKRIANKVATGEAQLDKKGPRELIKNRHSTLLTPDQISDIKIDAGGSFISLIIRSSQGKYKFWLPLEGKTIAKTIQNGIDACRLKASVHPSFKHSSKTS